MQAQAVVPAKRGDGRRALILLICGALLLVIGIVGLFSLQGKAVRFDAAYDSHGDMSPFFFGQLEEGQSYSFLQNLWLGVARFRLWVMLAGLAINLYMAGSVAAFYLRQEEKEASDEGPAADPPAEELN